MNTNTEKKDCYGIIGAMENEVAMIRQSMLVTQTEHIAGLEFSVGMIGEKKVVLVQSGIGKVNAGICAQILILQFGATKIINTGVAGALSEDLDIGDMVLPSEAVQHDFDVSVIGFQKGEIPYSGLVAFPADTSLQASAQDAITTLYPDFRICEGRICSGDQFIATVEQKKAIVSDFGGLCCDMESGAIAQVCHLNGIPWVILRAISDKVDGTGDSQFESFADLAAHCSSSVVVQMLSKA